VSEEGRGPAERPGAERLSPDRRSWWTGRDWVPPLYERSGFTALVTFLARFAGDLRVFPGAVIFAASDRGVRGMANLALNAERPPVTVMHTDPEVALVCGRFAVPWLNSGVVLVDAQSIDGGTAVVQLPGWERRPLMAALRTAGFRVDLHRRAFSIGSDIGSTAELDRLRRTGG
jgi:hypothetical protein